MNRNIKQMQDSLFSLLVTHTDIDLNNYPKARVFFLPEEFDALQRDVFQKAKLCFDRNQIASICEYKGDYYLIVPSVYEKVSLPSMSLVEDIKELGIVYIVENSILPLDSATKFELEQFVFTDENVEDIAWEVVQKYFPEYSIFKIDDKIPTNEDALLILLKRWCIALVCLTLDVQQLPFDNDTINAFMDIVNSDNDDIPYDNILRSILSYHWKFCFVDLYQCQERLLKFAWIEDFKIYMNSGLPLKELSEKMKDRYNGSYHENSSMTYLYNFLPQNILDILAKDDKAGFIYELRCKIVHFRPKKDSFVDDLTDSDWNMIVRFVLTTIPFLYDRFSHHFKELPTL